MNRAYGRTAIASALGEGSWRNTPALDGDEPAAVLLSARQARIDRIASGGVSTRSVILSISPHGSPLLAQRAQFLRLEFAAEEAVMAPHRCRNDSR